MHPADWLDPSLAPDPARAGAIKAGASYQRISAGERRRLEAAAIGARTAGVAVLVHAEVGTRATRSSTSSRRRACAPPRRSSPTSTAIPTPSSTPSWRPAGRPSSTTRSAAPSTSRTRSARAGRGGRRRGTPRPDDAGPGPRRAGLLRAYDGRSRDALADGHVRAPAPAADGRRGDGADPGRRTRRRISTRCRARRQRRGARWSPPEHPLTGARNDRYDVIVVGAGSAGSAAAISAARSARRRCSSTAWRSWAAPRPRSSTRSTRSTRPASAAAGRGRARLGGGGPADARTASRSSARIRTAPGRA